jgi:hypothetical protein
MRQRLAGLGLGICLLAGTATVLFAAGNRVDVSKIIDQAAAELILEQPVKSPAPRNVEGSDGYYSKCNYYTTDSKKRLILRVYQAAPGFDAQKELDAVAESTGAMRAVSGIGDKARVSSGVSGGLPSQVVMIYVVKGNALVTIGIGGFEDDNASIEKIKGAAQKIVSQL